MKATIYFRTLETTYNMQRTINTDCTSVNGIIADFLKIAHKSEYCIINYVKVGRKKYVINDIAKHYVL